MTPEAQRIAIAEACGWKFIEPPDEGFGGYWGFDSVAFDEIPDYLNDLNAMHEAEKALFSWDRPIQNEGYRTRYLDALLRICAGGFHAGIHATAAQRAEAFLKTLGKWAE